jgi:ubiquinone/menaquinone biosynthesis C-methylase UbiE
VFDQLELPTSASVLEVGCGPGSLWRANGGRIPQVWQVTLSDFSPGMLADARRALAEVGRPFSFQEADVQWLPFDDDQFDGVIANHMLYHVADRPRAFAEVARVLRPAGRFYASTNGRDHLKEIKDLYVHKEPWGFRMEEAADELGEAFTDVELDVYPDSLEVTEVEPVVAFVHSMDSGVEGFEELVRARIEAEGSFHVTKVGGLFSCRKP